MKVKRINDYTLQVMLQKDELTERGIGMIDLMGNQQQMEDFFPDRVRRGRPSASIFDGSNGAVSGDAN